MSIKDKILSGLAVIGSVFAAIFYVLFQQKKDEKQAIEEAYQRTKEETEAQGHIIDVQKETAQAGIQEQKENEEKIHEALNGHNLNNYDACNELLSK